MPTYTLKDNKTGDTWPVFCSYEELQTILNEMPDVSQQLSAPKIVSVTGSTINKTPDGFKDVLNKMKAGSGKGNSIRT